MEQIQHGKWKDATQFNFQLFIHTRSHYTHTHRANTLICTTKLSKSNYRIARITRHVNYRARHVNINAQTRAVQTPICIGTFYHLVRVSIFSRRRFWNGLFWFLVLPSVTIQRPSSVNTFHSTNLVLPWACPLDSSFFWHSGCFFLGKYFRTHFNPHSSGLVGYFF